MLRRRGALVDGDELPQQSQHSRSLHKDFLDFENLQERMLRYDGTCGGILGLNVCAKLLSLQAIGRVVGPNIAGDCTGGILS